MLHRLRITGVATAVFLAACILAPAPPALAEEGKTHPGGDPGGLEEALTSAQVPPDWWYGVRQDIAASEYQVSWQTVTSLAGSKAAWQAPNRAHGFRTYFTGDGITVMPRSSNSQWQWQLMLIGYGRAGKVWPVSAVEQVEPDGGRLTYRRTGLDEWFANSAAGLEHGFTLPAPPEEVAAITTAAAPLQRPLNGRHMPMRRDAGDRRSRPVPWTGASDEDEPDISSSLLHLDLAIGGNLRPQVASDGQAVDFYRSDGMAAVHYGKLKVSDATGRDLPAWMEGFAEDGGGIRLVFDSEGAIFPITIDPLATTPSWWTEGDQAGARLGNSVATAGDVDGDGYADVIIGAFGYDNGQSNEGRAFLYRGSPSGLSPEPAWFAESNRAGAQLGFDVATAGDVNGDGFSDVIIGANGYSNGQSKEGAAYIFLGSADGLSSAPDRILESNTANSQLGFSVGSAGDVNGDGFSDVIAGAWIYKIDQSSAGAAYVFLGSPTGIPATPAWFEQSDILGAQFGYSVGTAGDVNGDGYADIIIGARRHENGQVNEGAAFVYHGSAAGPGSEPDWHGEIDQADAQFGFSVSTAGDTNGDGYADVIVGAYRYENGEASEGGAFVFMGSSDGLAAEPAWQTEGNQEKAYAGWSVGTAGDMDGDGFADILVGSVTYDDVVVDEGRAWLFRGSPTGPESTPGWEAGSGQAGAFFGKDVATAGDVNGDGFADIIIGAYTYDNGEQDEGAAYVYMGAAGRPAPDPAWMATSEQPTAFFGWSVASAGDVDGDGHGDVITGASFYDNGETDEGAAWLFRGTATGLEDTPSWSMEGGMDFAGLGSAVAGAGDVNGDGYADVIVGAPQYKNGQRNEGVVYGFSGSPTGLSTSPSWIMEGNKRGARFGWSLGSAGDVNGDGYADIVIGARHYRNGQASEGKAFVYLGSATGIATTPVWTAEGNQNGALFGDAVASAGDTNGDGYGDIIVGARLYDNGKPDEGAAFVYMGSPSGLSPSPAWTGESNQALAEFGSSVAGAGDVNGDGYADVIVGARLFDSGQLDEGAAFLYLGSETGLQSTAAWMAQSDQPFASFGGSVAGAGDINGDGFTDLMIGAWDYDNGEGGEGAAWIYAGSAAGPGPQPVAILESNQAGAQMGSAVSSAGDINSDGFMDLVIGARLFDNTQPDEGAAMVFYGNGRAGVNLSPRSMRSDLSVPIPPWGWSDQRELFALSTRAQTPFGGGKVKLQWEVKPRGVLFDGTDTGQAGQWVDVNAADLPAATILQEAITGLTPGTDYHWRLRLRYHPATTPFSQASRWLTNPDNGWNEADLSTALHGDLSITIVDAADPITNIETLQYNLNVANTGLDDDTAVVVTSLLPAGAEFQAATPSQGSCSPATGSITCTLGPLASGAGATIDIRARAPLTGGPATFSSSVTGANRDPDPADNAATESTEIVAVCFVPSLPLLLQSVQTSGVNPLWTLLNFEDSNTPADVDGYNIYRSNDAALAPAAWPLLGASVSDADGTVPGIQWSDSTGELPAANEVFFYQVTAYNETCDADGPR